METEGFVRLAAGRGYSTEQALVVLSANKGCVSAAMDDLGRFAPLTGVAFLVGESNERCGLTLRCVDAL